MISLDPCDKLLRPLSKIQPPDDLKAEIDEREGNVKKWLDKINKIDA